MAKVTTRIEPIERSIMLAIREGEPPAERGRRLAGYARQALAEAQEVNRRATGVVPPHSTYVDGRLGAPLESVKPDGVIVFEFDLLNDLFEWIGEMLVANSPVLTGRYASSHAFFADGVKVEPGADLPEAGEYAFVSTTPYSRKIERGLSPQAPEGVYEAVALLARRRFGNIASIRFSYRALFAQVRGGDRHERAKRGRAPVADRFPAIVVTVR